MSWLGTNQRSPYAFRNRARGQGLGWTEANLANNDTERNQKIIKTVSKRLSLYSWRVYLAGPRWSRFRTSSPASSSNLSRIRRFVSYIAWWGCPIRCGGCTASFLSLIMWHCCWAIRWNWGRQRGKHYCGGGGIDIHDLIHFVQSGPPHCQVREEGAGGGI